MCTGSNGAPVSYFISLVSREVNVNSGLLAGRADHINDWNDQLRGSSN